MDWKIKRFSELAIDELYDLLALRCQVFVLEQNCPYLDCDGLDRNAYHLFGYDETGAMAGSLRILDKGQTFPELAIGRVVVPEAMRGRGYAREMMIKALAFARNVLGERRISISAQEYLLDFYASLGFVKVSGVYLEDGIPHADMIFEEK